jgi:hypothetical protein
VNPTLSGFLIGCPSGLFLRLNWPNFLS